MLSCHSFTEVSQAAYQHVVRRLEETKTQGGKTTRARCEYFNKTLIHINAVPLKAPPSCLHWVFLVATVTTGLLIKDKYVYG